MRKEITVKHFYIMGRADFLRLLMYMVQTSQKKATIKAKRAKKVRIKI